MAITPGLWAKRVQITEIATTGVSESGYVALLTGSNMPADIWSVAENGGGDLRICLNRDGTGQLPLEVVTFDTVSEAAVLWFRFPVFTSGGSIWLFYGKAGEAQPPVTDPFGRNAVWADFNGVFHFVSDASNSVGANDGVVVGAALQPGGGYEFTGTGRIELPDAIFNGLASDHTINFDWLNDGTLNNGHFFDSRVSNDTGVDIQYRESELGGQYDPPGLDVNLVGTSYPSGALQYRAWYVRATSSLSIFVDDQAGVVTSITGDTPSSTSPVKIGNQANNGDPLGAGRILKRVTLRDFAISEDTRLTEYANQSDPATFWSTGTPELIPLIDQPSTSASASASASAPDSVSLVGPFSVTDQPSTSASVSAPDSVSLVGPFAVSSAAATSASVSTPDSVSLVGPFSVTDQPSVSASVSATDSVLLSAQVTIADQPTISASVSAPDSVLLSAAVSVTDRQTASASVSAPDSVSLVGPFVVESAAATSNSTSSADSVTIGSVTVSPREETNIFVSPLSRAILVENRSRNINV